MRSCVPSLWAVRPVLLSLIARSARGGESRAREPRSHRVENAVIVEKAADGVVGVGAEVSGEGRSTASPTVPQGTSDGACGDGPTTPS